MSFHRDQDTTDMRRNQYLNAIENRMDWLPTEDQSQIPSALEVMIANLRIDDQIFDIPDVEMIDVFDIDQVQDVEMTDVCDLDEIQIPDSFEIEMTDIPRGPPRRLRF
ncbi:hypothetical protein FSPOR_1765 [Fusarium sporotrichioides]|uniref:Uncharacterized protein n=1 Tax=Fusarium sporotrichioides TaxID=5514 RepID=A0A395SNL8_FUSSP|nr:hypothetical protein FSPOR_1765 [Fusarium sporotrichioides]